MHGVRIHDVCLVVVGGVTVVGGFLFVSRCRCWILFIGSHGSRKVVRKKRKGNEREKIRKGREEEGKEDKNRKKWWKGA